jgi:gluconate 2-dehydrogenase gamma chain
MNRDRRELLKDFALLAAAFAAQTRLVGCKKVDGGADASSSVDASDKRADGGAPAAETHALKPMQRETLGAAVERILPTDQDPGAKEANVIEFLDRELAHPGNKNVAAVISSGIVALDRLSLRHGGARFAALSAEEQDEIIREVQNKSGRGRDFVSFLVYLTLEGFLGDPRYGGNAGGVGWKFIGYGPGTVDGTVTRCNDDQ